jgi:hypothetical protein
MTFRLPLRATRALVRVAYPVLVRPMRWSPPIVAALVMWLGGCDNVTNTYSTPADARNDGLFDDGWLPDILPFSAYDIRVTFDPDKDRVEGEFSFNPVDFPRFAAQFESFYQPFEYSADGRTWVFFCDSLGHCYFSVR